MADEGLRDRAAQLAAALLRWSEGRMAGDTSLALACELRLCAHAIDEAQAARVESVLKRELRG